MNQYHVRVNLSKPPLSSKSIEILRNDYKNKLRDTRNSFENMQNGFFVLFVGFLVASLVNISFEFIKVDLYLVVLIAMSLTLISHFEKGSRENKSQIVAPISLMAASVPFFVESEVTLLSCLMSASAWFFINLFGNRIAKQYKANEGRISMLMDAIKGLETADELTLRKIVKCKSVPRISKYLRLVEVSRRKLTCVEANRVLNQLRKERSRQEYEAIRKPVDILHGMIKDECRGDNAECIQNDQMDNKKLDGAVNE